jgi:hypothetical protein
VIAGDEVEGVLNSYFKPSKPVNAFLCLST